MIASAAVVVFDKRQNKIVTIPCHRHCDAYYILYTLGYKEDIDYDKISEGFLTEDDDYLSRIDAYKDAVKCHQLPNDSTDFRNLYSEDLW